MLLGTRNGTVLLVAASSAALVLFMLRRRSRRNALNRRKTLLTQQLQEQLTPTKLVLVDNGSIKWEDVEEEVMEHVSLHPTVGFDCEWVKDSKVALLQLALTDGRCYLVRLCKMRMVPKTLFAILMDKEVLKLGVGIQEDAKRMENDYGVKVRGFVDLRHLVSSFRPNLQNLGLAGLSEAFLGVQMDKDWTVRAGNWEEEELSQRQLDYAAGDALAGINVGLAMLREKMDEGEKETLWTMCRPFRDRNFKQNASILAPALSATVATIPVAAVGSGGTAGKVSNYALRSTPLFPTARLETPDGQPLCTCRAKKAEMYISKSLGTMVAEEPFTVRLNFVPPVRPEDKSGEYYLTPKENVCVVCGNSKSFVKKCIVPKEYCKHYPGTRGHMSHDVLLLCSDCHKRSSLKNLELKRRLESECATPREKKARFMQVRSAAKAITNDVKGKIPKEKMEELEMVLKEYYGVEKLSEDMLAEGAKVLPSDSNEPHGKKVVDHFIMHSEEGILGLQKLWRQHFLDTMEPKFMPKLWSVDYQLPEEKVVDVKRSSEEKEEEEEDSN